MNLAIRSHYGMRNLAWKGVPTGMYYGVLKFALHCQSLYPSARVVFLWEGTNSKRKMMDDSYKSSRTKDNEVRNLVQELKPMFDNLNVDQMYHIGLEADDLAGYMVHTLKPYERVLLVTTDEDWFQFMRNGTVDIQRRDNIETYSDVQDSLGFPPDRIGIWKILKGDKSDSISGIKNFPSSVARLLANRCDDFRKIKTYPLHKHNEVWVRWEKEINDQWTRLESNADMIIFRPDWIETSQLVVKSGKKDNQFLLKAMEDRGIKSLQRELR
jgi:5'-3' exonuclease